MLQWRRASLSGREGSKGEIPLFETIDSIRAQLSEAAVRGADQEIQFPVEGVTLKFHVGVTRNIAGNGGVQFWVVQLGASASHEVESVHKVEVRLGAPVDAAGQTVKVQRTLSEKP